MGKTRLARIEIQHLRSIKGTMAIDFPDKGMVMIRSRNLDSNGSSGGGKSSVLVAINAALDCAPYPLTELQSWGVEDPLTVKLTLESEKYGSVVVTRGAKSSIKVGDAKPIISAKAVQEKVREVLGLDPSLLAALTYCPQQDQEDFLTKTNSEKQEFLSTLLGLEQFEAAVEQAQASQAVLVPKLTVLEASLASAESHHLTAKNELVPADLRSENGAVETLASAGTELAQAEERALVANETWTLGEAERTSRLAAAGTELRPAVDAAAERVEKAAVALSTASKETAPVSSTEQHLAQTLKVGRSKLQEVQNSDLAREAHFQAEMSRLDTQIATVTAQARRMPLLREDMTRIRSEILALEASVCPTCAQNWADAKQKVSTKVARLVEANTELDGLVIQDRLLPGLKAQRQVQKFEPSPLVEQLRDAIEGLNGQLAAEQQKREGAQHLRVAELQTRLAEAQAAEAVVKQQVQAEKQKVEAEGRVERERQWSEVYATQRKVTDCRATRQAAQTMLDEIRRANSWENSKHLDRMSKVQGFEAVVAMARANVETAQADVKAEADFIKLVGREGFLGVIFDEVLAEISAETNAILGRVANTTHVALEFRSEVESLKGKVRKEIRPVVTIGGFEAPLKSGCSGGMYSAVRLAVRVAVRRVCSRRTGSFPCWLALDESFDGLDHVSKEACMEILAEAAREDLILVVDHSSEFKELFTQFLDLEFKNGETRLAEAQ